MFPGETDDALYVCCGWSSCNHCSAQLHVASVGMRHIHIYLLSRERASTLKHTLRDGSCLLRTYGTHPSACLLLWHSRIQGRRAPALAAYGIRCHSPHRSTVVQHAHVCNWMHACVHTWAAQRANACYALIISSCSKWKLNMLVMSAGGGTAKVPQGGAPGSTWWCQQQRWRRLL